MLLLLNLIIYTFALINHLKKKLKIKKFKFIDNKINSNEIKIIKKCRLDKKRPKRPIINKVIDNIKYFNIILKLTL